MMYELFHKNEKVLKVNYFPETNNFGKIITIYKKEHLPIDFEEKIKADIKNFNISQTKPCPSPKSKADDDRSRERD